MQPSLGSPPENIVGLVCPFVREKMRNFYFIQAATKVLAKVFCFAHIRQQSQGAAAVAAGELF